MLLTSGLSETYWEEARKCAGFTYNRLPRKGNELQKSPYELFFNRQPHIAYFKIFGSTAYVHKPIKNKDHSAKAWKGIFVGYESSFQQGYRVYLQESNEIIVSTHVKFTCESTDIEPVTINDITPIQPDDTTITPTGRKKRKCTTGTPTEEYKWLINSRHIDDEDHLLYETVKVYTYKGDIVCDRLRVDHNGKLVTNGYDGP